MVLIDRMASRSVHPLNQQRRKNHMTKHLPQRLGLVQKIVILLTISAVTALMCATPIRALDSSKRLSQAAETSNDGARSQQAHQLILLAQEQVRLWDYQEAIVFLEEALTIFRSIDNRLGEAEALRQLGEIYFFNLDQPDRAIASFSEAIAISDDAGASGEQLFTKYFALNDLGDVYSFIGQHQRAIDFYQQALTLMQNYESATAASLSRALMQLGYGYSGAGEYAQALELHHKALEIAEANRDFETAEIALANIGNVHETNGQYRQAIESYQQTLDLTQEFTLYRYHGTINDNKHYDRLTARYLFNLGRAYLKSGQLQLAENFLTDAVYLMELLRSAGLNDTANIAELESIEGAYYFLQRALLLQGKSEAALEVAERSRAQAFSELLAQQLAPNAAVTPDAPPNLDQLKAIAKDKQSPVILYPVTKSSPEPVDTSGSLFLIDIWVIFPDERVESRQYVLSDEKITNLAAVTRQAVQVLDRTDSIPQFSYNFLWKENSQIEARSPYGNYIEQRILSDLVDSLSDISRGVSELSLFSVGEDVIYVPALNVVAQPDIKDIKSISQEQQATLVEYSITDVSGLEPMLSIWVVTPDGKITFRQKSLSGTDIASLVKDTRQTIGVRGTREGMQADFIAEYIPQRHDRSDANLTQLHGVLIDPIVDLLPADPNQAVVFIPQGELFLVPFAALKNNAGDYLIENHTILTAPSIQILQLTQTMAKTRQEASIQRPLIVGNPTMPNVTLLNDQGAFKNIRLNPLMGAQQEAERIAMFLQSPALIGAQATEAVIKQRLTNADLIHLATHGLLEHGDPRETGSRDVPGAIALTSGNGEDGLLTSREILQMELQADLAVLSACDTGRGRITGDGVIGLSRSFIAAGVPSVVVSLWAVPDSPTADLMTEFYRQLEQNPSKAQALRQAMLITMQTHPNPRDWAAFTLIGKSDW